MKLRLRSLPSLLRTGVLVLAAVVTLAPAGIAQHVPANTPQGAPADTPPPAPPSPNDISWDAEPSAAARGNPNNVPSIATARVRRERFIHEYFQNLNRDAERIHELAAEFKDYAAKNPGPDLSPEMIKKIRRMGDVSHDLRKRMYNRNLPHVRNSGITFLPPAQTDAAEGPPPHFQPMANLCFEFAAHLRQAMDQHLETTNLNTVAFSPAQLELARDIVTTARRIEGLAYELEHKQL